MKRLILCIVISCSLIGLSAASLLYMRTSCQELVQTLDQMTEAMRKEDTQTALKTYDMFLKQWEEKEKWLELMIRHQHLDEVSVSSRALPSYIEHKASAQFFAEASKIRLCLQDIWEKEQITLPNLL